MLSEILDSSNKKLKYSKALRYKFSGFQLNSFMTKAVII